jgi:hypothetical protein
VKDLTGGRPWFQSRPAAIAEKEIARWGIIAGLLDNHRRTCEHLRNGKNISIKFPASELHRRECQLCRFIVLSMQLAAR